MTIDYANNLVAEFLADAREPHYPHLVDLADLLDIEPTDAELAYVLAEQFDMPLGDMVDRLARVDMAALREVVTP